MGYPSLPMPGVAEDLGGGGGEVIEGDMPTPELGLFFRETFGSKRLKGSSGHRGRERILHDCRGSRQQRLTDSLGP
ncbi:MAG: hypothetical protein NZ807_12840 [Dehalococcoidia bacterium]|nr:hypothetical protein [Dehalococcoidia bacterium]